MLYQQGTQRIEVIVRKEGGTGVSGGAGTKETDADKTTGTGGDEEQNVGMGSGMSKRTKRIIKTNITHAMAVSKQIIGLGIEYHVGGIGLNNGDQALQDQISRKVELVQDTASLASSVAMGALYGAWGGPVGAVLGAVFGLASTGASLGVKYARREREYDYKIFKEESSIEYQRARAGTDWTNGRLR